MGKNKIQHIGFEANKSMVLYFNSEMIRWNLRMVDNSINRYVVQHV